MMRVKDRHDKWMRTVLLGVFGAVALMLALCCAMSRPAGVAVADESGKSKASGLVAVSSSSLQTQTVISTQQAQGDISWYVGHSSPYTVRDINQLIGLSYLVNTGTDSFQGKVVQMPGTAGQLAFLGTSIVPIGTSSNPFNGTFNGNGWTLNNLTLDTGSSLSNIGLFGYAGSNASIKNVRLVNGTVTVTNTEAGKKIANVGAVAGYLGGSIEGCYSSVAIDVTNNGAVPTVEGKTADTMTIILGVGGLVGTLGADMTNCTNAGEVKVSSTSNVTDNVPYIAGYVGGLVGLQGDTSKSASANITTKNCTNSGAITFNVSGSGGVDRFGQQMYSSSSMVGGIAGYSMASFTNCKNTAAVQTGIVKDGKTQAGWGASTVGGIVGSLRGPAIAKSQSATGVVGTNETDPGYTVWKDSNGQTKPATLQVLRCSNTGNITGLASVGGIAGSTGAFTKAIGCSNTASIEGTRWNKPCPAGIVGISNGDIGYCYNQGRCFSTTGGGYYASGIAALLTTYNTTSTPTSLVMDVPELYACYVTGSVGGSETGYRTAVLAGENDGFIHDNCFLPNLTVDKAVDKDVFGDENPHSRLVVAGQDRGTLANNHELSAADMKTSLAVSYLNSPNAQKSDWSLYYAPQPGNFPVLNWQGSTTSSPVALSSVATGVAKVENPAYSALYAPVPTVTLTTSGTKLYQNADYKVVVNPSAKAVGGNYTATIEGINGYAGTLGATAAYSIAKASIGTCKVQAEAAVFNWERQKPKSVTVRDAAGNVVDPSEYTWDTLPNADGSTKAVDGKYYDYVNCHGEGYKYDVKVTAKDASANYTGATTQACFRIDWASLMYSPDNEGRTDIPESAKLGDVVYGGQTWPIAQALKTKGFVKIKYTGKEIKPTMKSVTYLGRDMRDGTGKPYYYYPLDYDYRYVYGNPNPEPGSEDDNQCINVTGTEETKLGCVTVRFTSGGNFDNYTNVFYEITPASIVDDVKVAGIASSYTYTGKAVTVSPTLTYNGMTLKEGTDYTLSYKDNTGVGQASMTITGKGNYAGSASKTFTINPANLANATVSVPALTYTGKALTPKPIVKLDGTTLKQGTDYTVSVKDAKGKVVAAKNLKAAGTYSATITGKGVYTGSVSASFTIKPASLAKAKASVPALTYTGKALTPKPKVKVGGTTLKKGADYTISVKNGKGKAVALKKLKAVGSYKLTATGKGNYKGSITVKLKVNKGKNTIKAKGKTVPVALAKVKKAKQTVKASKAFTVKKAQGKVTYKKASGNAKIAVSKAGKLTVKKGLKKGSYTVKVKITAAGNANYSKLTKTVTVVVKVK